MKGSPVRFRSPAPSDSRGSDAAPTSTLTHCGGLPQQGIQTMWYATHAVLYVEWKDGIQPYVPVWENIYLVEAADGEDAERQANRLGEQDQGDDDGTFSWDGRAAKWVFAGVRKVIECS